MERERKYKDMDIIKVITTNAEGEWVETVSTVNDLIHVWLHDADVPTNDDAVVCCFLGKTQLHFETFGSLMQVLTGVC